MSETNKALVRRFYAEVMSQGQVEVLDEIMAADFRDHGETLFGSPQGRETLKPVSYTHLTLPTNREV